MTPSTFSSVEPLESRIAPAAGITIFVGRPDPDTNDTNYSDLPFHAANSGGPNYDTSDSVGANFVGSSHAFTPGGLNTFYVKLSPGDAIKIYSEGGYQSFLT